jgi:hypothetical protein
MAERGHEREGAMSRRKFTVDRFKEIAPAINCALAKIKVCA